MRLLLTIFLASGIWCHAQRGTGANPVATTEPTPVSIFAMPAAVVAPFKQIYLTWDNEPGASNRVSWGLSREAWTNGVRTVTTNQFPITNGWSYKVTAMLNGIESVPALWPSNRFDRVIVQTSTNLTQWTDAFIWSTNFNKPQEFLRLRSEVLQWE